VPFFPVSQERRTVIAFPWYLLSFGIFVVIIGCLFAGLRKPTDSGRRAIDSTMRDDEIIQNLNSGHGVSLLGLVILFGLLCILVSVVWRIILYFV
jgi:hypothetical protein